jgi:hypothetical protein
MPITIAGSGTITGISAGGLPDGVITTDDIAANAVTYAKIGTTEQGQLCKAWVNFNGTGTVAIRASYNVSSITDNGVGDYTVNFTSALADANYCAAMSLEREGTSSAYTRIIAGYNGGRAAGSLRLVYEYPGDGTKVDGPAIYVAIFR